MKSSRILVSLVLGAVLCSSVFAQDATQTQTPQTEKRSEMKAKRDQRIKDGKASSLRSARKRQAHGKAATLENKGKRKHHKKADGNNH